MKRFCSGSSEQRVYQGQADEIGIPHEKLLYGVQLENSFCELCDSSQDGGSQSRGRQGQGDCH